MTHKTLNGEVITVAAIGIIPVDVPLGPGLRDDQLVFLLYLKVAKFTYPRISINFASSLNISLGLIRYKDQPCHLLIFCLECGIRTRSGKVKYHPPSS